MENRLNLHQVCIYITWGTDTICIRFAYTKTDMDSSDQAHIRHVYANPYNLKICAVTALAKYLATFPPNQDGKLFDEKSYKWFQKYLKKVVQDNEEDIERMGVSPDDIGVHSIRKGAATYCSGETTSAPHIAALCNRAGMYN